MIWLALSIIVMTSPTFAAVTSSLASVAGHTFDYIVVGAGLTGTTVAARLAENSNVSVLLVEAGSDNRKDPRVFDMYQYSKAFKSELDWSWQTDHGNMIR